MSLDTQIRTVIALKKFLVIITVIFLLVVSVLWWLEINKAEIELEVESTIWKSFSEEGVRTDYVSDYQTGAIYIHDLEAVPGINDLFFSKDRADLLTELIGEKAMIDVQTLRAKATTYETDLIYHTSYYMGNLPLHSNLSLFALLNDSSRPSTAALLETILADVRASAVKLQDYFDVAPPYYYDQSLATQFYYNAPSFPSLTAAEAITIWLVLAELDKPNARIYELESRAYLKALLHSGANFVADVEYGAKLAALLVTHAQTLPGYQSLLAAASLEWKTSFAIDVPTLIWLPFVPPAFPYVSEFNLFYSPATSTVNQPSEEALQGSIGLSLKDNRIPGSHSTLYEYDLAAKRLIPVAPDLQSRRFPQLAGDVYSGQLTGLDQYIFISSEKTIDGQSKSSNLFMRAGDSLNLLSSSKADEYYSQPFLSLNRKRLLLTLNQIDESSKEIQLLSLDNPNGPSLQSVSTGMAAVFGPRDESVIYLDEQGISVKSLSSNTPVSLLQLVPDEQFVSRQLTINQDRNLLLVVNNFFDPETRRQQTRIDLYDLDEVDTLTAVAKGSVLLRDAEAYGAALSAGGRYLAFAISETPAKLQPRLLIFDLNSGIVKKDINLQSFSPLSITVDGWN